MSSDTERTEGSDLPPCYGHTFDENLLCRNLGCGKARDTAIRTMTLCEGTVPPGGGFYPAGAKGVAARDAAFVARKKRAKRMHTKSTAWKEFERWVSKQVGGSRRGPHTGRGFQGSGMNDVILEGFSLECKKLVNPLPSDMSNALLQAEAAIDSPFDIAMAFVAKNRAPYRDSISIMRSVSYLKLINAKIDWPSEDFQVTELPCVLLRASDACLLITQFKERASCSA